ncbi:MAG: energy coupling factor transporter S component ThiW [Firmicutes bacterium]|nr:energy coupling factor transporter S component ThiW [Bacillota bacterium]
MKNPKVLKMAVLAMLVALGVIISPILRVEGMCPMAHFINITAAVLLGPYYALLCAFLIGVIRMAVMGIPPLALTGAVFGAFLSGMLYRASKGKLIFAVIGEVIGTGLIGAIISYPVMTIFWGRTDLTWLFYVPSFISGTLIGGSIAFIFIKQLIKAGLLAKYQAALGSKVYDTPNTVLSDSLGICFIGIIAYLAVLVLVKNLLKLTGSALTVYPLAAFLIFAVTGAIYYFVNMKKVKE